MVFEMALCQGGVIQTQMELGKRHFGVTGLFSANRLKMAQGNRTAAQANEGGCRSGAREHRTAWCLPILAVNSDESDLVQFRTQTHWIRLRLVWLITSAKAVI